MPRFNNGVDFDCLITLMRYDKEEVTNVYNYTNGVHKAGDRLLQVNSSNIFQDIAEQNLWQPTHYTYVQLKIKI